MLQLREGAYYNCTKENPPPEFLSFAKLNLKFYPPPWRGANALILYSPPNMPNIILDNTYLILLLPLWIFLIIMCGRFFSVYVNKRIIYTLTLLSSFLGALLCSVSLLQVGETIEQSVPFIKINNFMITCGVHIDKLSLIIALCLFVISFFVQAFSIAYMKNKEKNYRFFAYLNLFNFTMAGLLFSPNLFQMYFFWELVGVMSYLLIGFDYKKKEKSDASRRVFLMNRVGDTALIAGIISVSYFMYNYAGNSSFATLSFEDMNAISTLLSAYTSTPMFYLISGLFIVGAAVKSAQFPFYTWLQDAMEAELPVSALLHSATMVVAGVYLLIRMLPFFSLDNHLLIFIMILGFLTALVCSILASIETHPKKVLAYSTSANLGLMFLAVGAQNVKAAIVFLIAHALIKSMLFLSLATKNSYVGYVTFLLGALSLSGLIFSGMVAKEILFGSLSGIGAVLFCVVSFITAFYIIRISILMILDEKLENKIDWAEYLPIAILFVLNIAFYFFIRRHSEYKIAEPFYTALAGWIFVYICYTKNWLIKLTKTPKLLEKFYNHVLSFVYEKIALVCNFVDVNVLSNYKPFGAVLKFGVKVSDFVETYIMNGVVNIVANGSKKISETDSILQSGNAQTYNAYAFILVTIVITFVLVTYKWVLSQMGIG